MNFDLIPTHDTKVTSKWTLNLNLTLKYKAVKILEENLRPSS